MTILSRFGGGPPRPSGIRTPGLLSLGPGMQRYHVEGGGAILFPVSTGDQLTIQNPEGGQVAEVVTTSPHGQVDPGVLGLKATGDAAGLKALLGSRAPSLRRLATGLIRRGIDLQQLRSAAFFDSSSPAGDAVTLTAERDGLVIIAAPGPRMQPDAQDTLTPLTVMVKAALPGSRLGFELPDPLADPLQDIRVHSATAQSYVVKKGEFIQILDVDGRQCTDFQCFDLRKVDRGLTHPLDVTTTRTVQGHAYPIPGLHAKYFDQDLQPLVRIIQDTCGRHDAFAMACNAKYYDDIGYPGHVNCSDNFNRALDPYGIEKRPGWMAVNFFFNTGIDAHGVMYADEPWSRPGDYVLMEAMTDILCVTSACPDDTSPANGWHLSDIHVRTYSGNESFQRGVAWRSSPSAEPKLTRETGFHDRFAKLTDNFVEYKGFWLPDSFPATGLQNEYWACREKVVVMDLSALRKFEVTGPDAEALMNYCVTRDMRKLAEGQVVYTAMCYPHGGMIDDGTVYRMGRDNFRWIGGTDVGGDWLREKAEELNLKVMIRSSTDQLHNIAVQGPNSRELMEKIIWTAPHKTAAKDLQWFHFTVGRIGGELGTPVVLSRTGYTGELGYEIFCHPDDAGVVFDAVWEAGQPLGIKPMGLQGLDMVRIEAGLIFAGYDFSDQTDPFEAGISFTVPLKGKQDDFVGREALQRRKDHPSRKMVGLVIDSDVDVGHGDPVHIGRAQIGEVTSSMRSPLLGKNIALARVDVAHSEVGTAVEIGKLDHLQKRLPAEIVTLSHYDPTKSRPRS